MIVALTSAATRELAEVWFYNAKRYSPSRADRYVAFLRERIDTLATEYEEGEPVTGRPGLRQITMRRGQRGHGHIAVYRVTPTSVNVLHVFHTAQDISGRLADEP